MIVSPRYIEAVYPDNPPARIAEIVTVAADVFGVEPADLYGTSRLSPLTLARHTAWLVCRRITLLSYPALGEAFGRNHSTLVSAVERLKKRIEADERVRLAWDGPRIPLADLADLVTSGAARTSRRRTGR